MRVLLTDLDRTLTGDDLRIDPRVLARLAALRHAGYQVVIVTGRTLEHVMELGLHDACDGIVAENGAIVAIPQRMMLEVRDPDFGRDARAALGDLADAFEWGRVRGSGDAANAAEAVRRLVAAGLAHEVTFNEDKVLLVPEGVSKASGAKRVLGQLAVAASEAAAIGDGENDVPLLRLARLSAAPANACEAARAAADLILHRANVDGFLEFTDKLLAGDVPP